MKYIVTSNYNKQKKITSFINFFKNDVGNNYKIIIVDDSSVDNSKKILRKIKNKKINVYFNNKNSGKGFCLKKGLSKIKTYKENDIVILIDIDLPYKNKIKKFFNVTDKLKIISRRSSIKKNSIKLEKLNFYCVSRLIIGYSLNYAFRIFGLTKLLDTQAGLKAFKAKYLNNIKKIKTNNFLFDLELIILFENKIGVEEIFSNYTIGTNSSINLISLKIIKNLLFDLFSIFLNKKNKVYK